VPPNDADVKAAAIEQARAERDAIAAEVQREAIKVVVATDAAKAERAGK